MRYGCDADVALWDRCRSAGAVVVLDTCYSGVEFEEGRGRVELGEAAEGVSMAVLGGVSKEVKK